MNTAADTHIQYICTHKCHIKATTTEVSATQTTIKAVYTYSSYTSHGSTILRDLQGGRLLIVMVSLRVGCLNCEQPVCVHACGVCGVSEVLCASVRREKALHGGERGLAHDRTKRKVIKVE